MSRYGMTLKNLLAGLNSGMDPSAAYSIFDEARDERQAKLAAQRQAKMEARAAMEEQMAAQQSGLLDALSGVAISEAKTGASLQDVLEEMGATRAFMGVEPMGQTAQQLQAGLQSLFPNQVPYAPSLSGPSSPTGLRSIIAGPVELDNDDADELANQAQFLKDQKKTAAQAENEMFRTALSVYGPTGARSLLPTIRSIVAERFATGGGSGAYGI